MVKCFALEFLAMVGVSGDENRSLRGKEGVPGIGIARYREESYGSTGPALVTEEVVFPRLPGKVLQDGKGPP